MADSVKSQQELLLRAGERWMRFQRGTTFETALKTEVVGWGKTQRSSFFRRTVG